MKHEIGHIKNNDLFMVECVTGVCQLAAAVFGMCSLSFWPALGLSYAVNIVSQSLFLKWREAKADDFSIANSSNEELLGGRRLFKAIQEDNIKKRNTLWNRIAISSSGDDWLDILHPSLTSRIQKIEGVLRDRGCAINVEEEKAKINEGMEKCIEAHRIKTEQAPQRMGGALDYWLRQVWSEIDL